MKKHTIEVIDFTPETSSQPAYLCYEADGKQISVSGEFYRDKKGNYHHTHIFEDETVMDVVWTR